MSELRRCGPLPKYTDHSTTRLQRDERGVGCILFQLLVMMGVRKLLDYVFSYSDLYWLDHIMPGQERIEREDARAALQAHAYSPVSSTAPHRSIYLTNATNVRNAELDRH